MCGRGRYEERDPYFGVSLAFDTEGLLEDVRSAYQHIQVRQTRGFGKILLIDDDLMLTERDEASYHEMLVHVPLNYLSSAGDVLIIGGGDGGACREVLRHPNVQRVVLVDIDETVVEVSRRHFPHLANSCFDDPRVTLLHEDAALWADQAIRNSVAFDVVLVDSTDFGAADSLHTPMFYTKLRSLARDGAGIVVINLTSLSWNLGSAQHTVAMQASIFEHVAVYQVFQPTYMSGHYAYTFMSGAVDPLSSAIDWKAYEAKHLDAQMFYYTPAVHSASFQLPAYVDRVVGQRALRPGHRSRMHFAEPFMGMPVPRERAETAPPFLGPLPPFHLTEKQLQLLEDHGDAGTVVGNHTIVELWDADATALNDERTIRRALLDAAKAGQLTVLEQAFHSFEGQGVTGMLLLSSSHLTVHTWPEFGYAAVDIFTCSAETHPALDGEERGNADGEAAAASLLESLGASHSRRKSFTRGGPFSTT